MHDLLWGFELLNAGEYSSLEERFCAVREAVRAEIELSGFRPLGKSDKYNLNLLFGYVRSFVVLSANTDVAVAAEKLGTTRQTVVRHIQEFENMLGCALFQRIGANSKLTKPGALWLPRAQEIFELGNTLEVRRGEGRAAYRSTHLPLRHLLGEVDGPPILRGFAQAWLHGSRRTDCALLAPFLDSAILYEQRAGDWCATFIGPESALARWYGPERRDQSVGLSIADIASGSELRDEVGLHLDHLYCAGGISYSEIQCELQRDQDPSPVPVLYQRVSAELTDGNGAFTAVTVVEFVDVQKGATGHAS